MNLFMAVAQRASIYNLKEAEMKCNIIAGVCMSSSAMICLSNYFVAVDAVSVTFFIVSVYHVCEKIKKYLYVIISALMLVSQSWQIYILRLKIRH